MREKPLLPWIISECPGKVLAGHCNCMAGLGETCSHVASLLWDIEAGVRIRDSMTATQNKACWVLPPSMKDVPYAPLRQIKFTGKAGSMAEMMSPSPRGRSPTPMQPISHSSALLPLHSSASSPSSEEVDAFFASLSQCSTKPTILSLVASYIFLTVHPELSCKGRTCSSLCSFQTRIYCEII